MGKCRSASGGAMCPSYRATKEERYSTRGRGRLLNEMLRGEVITDGWQSEDVREALDSCLGCKSCRSECPTHTDMAAYKAEFLSHHYETKRRPLGAELMGRIGEWAPLAAKFPGLANALSPFGKSLAGVASGRSLPRFSKSFRASFAPGGQQGERVVLFDDTFNSYFRPQTARAAQKLLQSAGCAVELPREHLCCGRPYYDVGMLDRAKAALDRVLDVLPPGVPVVILEPGCLSVFRDELKQLFPRDARAARLQVFSLSEYLLHKNFRPVKKADVLVHSHCHQKAMWGAKSDLELLKAAGCTVSAPDTGCCGMSGSFGYRAQHYETSKRIAGLALLPALGAAPRAEVVACGFSCREQIEDLGKRPALHLADLLAG
jgi:Fe-S oxidoreductase